jgi:hypothetical protein
MSGRAIRNPRQPAAQSRELPAWVIEKYCRFDPELVLTILSLQRWEDDGGVPAQEGPPVDYSEPPTLRRKDFWSEYGPVRYRREYSGSPPIKRFREFFPWDKIGELALRPEIESRVKRLRAGHSWLPKCALGYDWEAERLFALADARRKIEGQKLPTVLHAFVFSAYEVEDAINSLHPSLPAAATADFFQSYDLYRHLCCFAYCLGEYGLRLGRSPGVWEEEVFRGLLCIWDQLGDYAHKVRLAMVPRTDPATKQETEFQQHAGRDARATPEAPVATTNSGRSKRQRRQRGFQPDMVRHRRIAAIVERHVSDWRISKRYREDAMLKLICSDLDEKASDLMPDNWKIAGKTPAVLDGTCVNKWTEALEMAKSGKKLVVDQIETSLDAIRKAAAKTP